MRTETALREDCEECEDQIQAENLGRALRADEQTRFSTGNTAWKQRRSHGRRCRFPCPEALYSACECYFQWVDDNPLHVAELVAYQGKAAVCYLPKMRAMTLSGLCNHLRINHQTWANYRKKPGFFGVIERVESIIWVYKFEGAAVGIFSSNIIAREMGLGRRATVARALPP